jgi:hypothetical protein
MRFFKPKWQHPDPAVRRQAVAALSSDSELLAKVAQEDETAEVRIEALSRILDLSFLGSVFDKDPDDKVREFATTHLSELLAGLKRTPHDLQTRLGFLKAHPKTALLEFVALQGVEPEMRQSAQAMVERQALLGEVAVKDPVIANRLAALERISDPDVLDRVYRETRKHDKQINRLSRTKLDDLKETEQRIAKTRQESEQICRRLEALGHGDAWERELAEFETLNQRWMRLSSEAEDGYRTRYAAAYEAFQRASASYRQVREAQEREWAEARGVRERILAELSRRRDEIDGLERLSEAAGADHRAELEAWDAAWGKAPALPADRSAPLNKTYQQSADAIRQRLDLLQARRETEVELNGLIDKAQHLLDAKRPLKENQLKSLEKSWESARDEADTTGLAESLERYEKLREQLRARLVRQAEKRKQELQQLPEMLDRLEELLDKQVSKEAGPLHDRIQSTLNNLQAMATAHEKTAPFLKRLHQLTPQVKELQSWRTWGADEARERLCEEMEELIGNDEKPAELAQRIRRLRAEWNRLRADGGTTGKTLRKRFDKAAEEAYRPCEIHFKQQAEQRQGNLQKKQTLLKRLDSFLAEVEWSHMEWKEAVKFQRQLSNDWRQTGPVDRRNEKTIESSYRQAMGVLEEHLELERQRNLAQRKGLIEKVRALMDVEDINKAVDECKQLQTQWQTSVPGKRKFENQIWEEFRAACDAVFARRRQLQEERHAEERQHKEELQRICTELEGLAQVELAELSEAERRLHKLLDAWKAVGPVAKRDRAALDERFDRAQKAFRQHDQALRQAWERAQLDLLRAKAEICRELEQGLEDSASSRDLEVFRQAWRDLSALADDALETAMQQRYSRVIAALEDGEDEKRTRLLEALTANLENRQEICLRLEILAGVDSPAEFQQTRMEYQANRLAEAMGQGEEDPVGNRAELEPSWYLSGAAPAAEEAKLQKRFEKVRQAMEGGNLS